MASAGGEAAAPVPAGAAGAAARIGGVEFQCGQGFATIKIRAGSGEGCANALAAAAEECIRRLGEVHAVLLRLDATGEGETPRGGGIATGDVPFDPVVGAGAGYLHEVLGRIPQLLVGFAERSTTCMETGLLAACDVAFVARGVALSVAERHGPGAAPSMPVPLLRLLCERLGPERLATLGRADLDGDSALRLGLAHEVLDVLALRSRREDLEAQLQSAPAAAVAAQRAAVRRRGVASAYTAVPHAYGDGPATLPPGRGRKRPPAPSALEHLPRKLLHTTAGRCDAVVSALVCGASLVEPAHGLVRSLVSESLGVSRTDREPFQQRVAGLIRDALDGVEAELRGALSSQQAEIDSAGDEHAGREAAEAKAESDVLALYAVVQEKRRQVAESTDALREALRELKDGRDGQETGDAEYTHAASEKEKLEEAEESEFLPLKAGSVTGAKAKKQAAALVALAKRANFDMSLLEGLQGALVTKPAQRDSLENMVIQAFETQVTTRIAELETAMAQLSPAREERALAMQSRHQAHDSARERQMRCIEELRAAEAAVRDAEAARAAHQRVVDSFGPELRQVRIQRALTQELLDDFLGGPGVALRELDPGPPSAAAPAAPADELPQSEGGGRESSPASPLPASEPVAAGVPEAAAALEGAESGEESAGKERVRDYADAGAPAMEAEKSTVEEGVRDDVDAEAPAMEADGPPAIEEDADEGRAPPTTGEEQSAAEEKDTFNAAPGTAGGAQSDAEGEGDGQDAFEGRMQALQREAEAAAEEKNGQESAANGGEEQSAAEGKDMEDAVEGYPDPDVVQAPEDGANGDVAMGEADVEPTIPAAPAEEKGGLQGRSQLDFVCRSCGKSSDEDAMLLCDGGGGTCNAPFHYYCVGLDAVPEGDWFCPRCGGE